MNHQGHLAQALSRRGVPGPALGIGAMVEAVISSLVSTRGLKNSTLANRVQRMRWFGAFLQAHGLSDLDAAIREHVIAFIDSRRASGEQVRLSERHSRRAAVRLLHKEARNLGLATTDPALDIQLPPRAPTHARPLTDAQIEACEIRAVRPNDTRLVVCLALAEAAAWTAEIPNLRVSDVDLETGTVRIHGGRTTDPRVGRLTPWGITQLQRRLESITADEGRDPILMGEGRWDDPDEGRAAATMVLTGIPAVSRPPGAGPERPFDPGLGWREGVGRGSQHRRSRQAAGRPPPRSGRPDRRLQLARGRAVRRLQSRRSNTRTDLRVLDRRPAAVRIEDGTASTSEVLDAVLREGAWLPATRMIPLRPKGSVGAPRKFPEFTWPLLTDLLWVIGSGSVRKLMRELGRGGHWRRIRKKLKRYWPELPVLPPSPPSRQSFQDYLNKYIAKNDETIEESLEIHAQVSAAQSLEAGNLNPNGGGSFTHPTVERTLYGDGKVIEPLYKSKPGTKRVNRETGEVREVRVDPDAALYTEGGGNKVYGIKLAVLSTRRAEGHFILSLEHVAKGHGETEAALSMLRRIKPFVPGAHAVVWDMILRGADIRVIMNEIGLIAVVGVHAKSNPDGKAGRKAGTYVPKTLDLEEIEVTLPDGRTEMRTLAAHDGWLSIKTIKENGEPHYERLTCNRIQRPRDKNTFRFYGTFRLPEEHGGGEISVRLHQTNDDDKNGINRAENLRPIPEGSEDFARLHVLRPDAESVNAMIERALSPVNGRAPTKGWRRNLALLLGWARMVNAVTLARCRGRAAPRMAA